MLQPVLLVTVFDELTIHLTHVDKPVLKLLEVPRLLVLALTDHLDGGLAHDRTVLCTLGVQYGDTKKIQFLL